MRKSSLLVLFLTVFIDLIGFGMVIPFLSFYAREYGASGKVRVLPDHRGAQAGTALRRLDHQRQAEAVDDAVQHRDRAQLGEPVVRQRHPVRRRDAGLAQHRFRRRLVPGEPGRPGVAADVRDAAVRTRRASTPRATALVSSPRSVFAKRAL